MRIGDAAAAAGTTPRALRFYEQRGLLPAPSRTATGQRIYTDRDVTRLRTIRELLSLGLTIEDVRASLDRLPLLENDEREQVCDQRSRVVNSRIAALDDEIGRLTRLRDQLAAKSRT
jgi:DNA-binding transcriptional MerR regulator